MKLHQGQALWPGHATKNCRASVGTLWNSIAQKQQGSLAQRHWLTCKFVASIRRCREHEGGAQVGGRRTPWLLDSHRRSPAPPAKMVPPTTTPASSAWNSASPRLLRAAIMLNTCHRPAGRRAAGSLTAAKQLNTSTEYCCFGLPQPASRVHPLASCLQRITADIEVAKRSLQCNKLLSRL